MALSNNHTKVGNIKSYHREEVAHLNISLNSGNAPLVRTQWTVLYFRVSLWMGTIQGYFFANSQKRWNADINILNIPIKQQQSIPQDLNTPGLLISSCQDQEHKLYSLFYTISIRYLGGIQTKAIQLKPILQAQSFAGEYPSWGNIEIFMTKSF